MRVVYDSEKIPVSTLSVIALTVYRSGVLAGCYLVAIDLGYLVKGVAEVVGEHGTIPEYVAYLFGNLEAALVAELSLIVAYHFLYLVGHLAGFSGQSQCGVDDGMGIDGGGECLLLKFIKIHKQYLLYSSIIEVTREPRKCCMDNGKKNGSGFQSLPPGLATDDKGKKESKGPESAAEATRKGIKKPPESPCLLTSYSSAGQKLVLFKEKDFLISTTSGCK